MHEYDVTLKVLLRGSAQAAIRELTGMSIGTWLDVELPKFQNPRVDLLGENPDGRLVHIELQSSNDSRMALRMAEYALGVYRLFDQFPRQFLVYVGEAPMRMPAQLVGPELSFRYEPVDFRDLDGERLLLSDEVADNVIAILARLRDRNVAVREIVRKLSNLNEEWRAFYLTALFKLAGLRKLEEVVEEEARKVPILNDILENKVLGREFKRGVEQGIEQGMNQGIEKGLEQGARKEASALLHRLIEKRFGALPAWAQDRIASRPLAELEDLSVRILDVRSLEELLN